MQVKETIRRIKLARDVIQRIPDELVHLENWYALNQPNPCGTIACAGGHLALSPEFNALGLYASDDSFNILHGKECGYSALTEVFGKWFVVTNLFQDIGNSEYDEVLNPAIVKAGGKELFLERIGYFLEYIAPRLLSAEKLSDFTEEL